MATQTTARPKARKAPSKPSKASRVTRDEPRESDGAPVADQFAGANAARAATRQRNAADSIDFSAGVSEVANANGVRQSAWVQKFRELAAGVERGDGEVDKYYRLGTFRSTNGAKVIAKKYASNPDALPCSMGIEHRTVPDDGSGIRSELWAAVAGPILLGEVTADDAGSDD